MEHHYTYHHTSVETLYRCTHAQVTSSGVYTVSQKKSTIFVSSITLSNVHRFLWFFHCCDYEAYVGYTNMELNGVQYEKHKVKKNISVIV